ncbi:MAG: hypothetical protein JRN37_06655 [Nitrososphaerota archaeon]|jgi:Fe2+ or Zn2+ uptake regulation protein|nr:hypothetical protein [Nitrososphaerota archaeon]MDG7038817.1 hypothetical protein [Nitrososphaerota archaeon]
MKDEEAIMALEKRVSELEKKAGYFECKHYNRVETAFLLDDSAHIIVCRDCGKILKHIPLKK